jgi:tripartite-type tricarboxylate transporter receptor subunit TctC
MLKQKDRAGSRFEEKSSCSSSSEGVQVPTVGEAGLPGFDYQDWWGVFAPAGTPPVVVDKIGKEIVRVLQFADIQNELLAQGAEARPSLPTEFANFVRTKIDAAREVAASANIRAN